MPPPLRGEDRKPSPTWLYPPSSPGWTGGTRVYPALCGRETAVSNAHGPQRGVPMPQTVQARPEGLGCIRRCVGGWEGLSYPNSPRGVPIPQTAQPGPEGLGCIRHCVGGWEGLSYLNSPRGIPIPQTAQARPEGLGCICRCVVGKLEFQPRMAPYKVSLSPQRPKQD